MKIPKQLRDAARRLGKLGGRPPKLEPCAKCGKLVSARARRLSCASHK